MIHLYNKIKNLQYFRRKNQGLLININIYCFKDDL